MHLYGLIPCYNESKSLPTSFPILNDLLAQTSKTLYGLLFVNDGSTDSTKQVLSGLRKQLPLQLRVQNIVLDLENNRGKAGAVFEGMKNLKEKEKIWEEDLLLLLDGDITEPLDPDMITDIQDRFLQNPQLQMVIIGVNEEYATDTVMIEASGQRVLKFWPAYRVLQDALSQNADLGYGLEELFNRSFKNTTYVDTKHVIVTQPAYRKNNPKNSAVQQRLDYEKSSALFPLSDHEEGTKNPW